LVCYSPLMKKLFVELNGTLIFLNSGMTSRPLYLVSQYIFVLMILKCSCTLDEYSIWLLGAKIFYMVVSSSVKLRPFEMKATEAVSLALALEMKEFATLTEILG